MLSYEPWSLAFVGRSAGTLLSKIAGISSSSSGDAGAGGNALGGVTLPSSSKLASFLDKLGE